MLANFIMTHFSYEESLRYLGFILIWAIIAGGKLASVKESLFLVNVMFWFITFGALLAFHILGYIFLFLSVALTIYSIVHAIRAKVGKSMR